MIDLYRLKFIIRYSNLPRVRDESVAEHSFFVTALCVQILDRFPDIDRGKVLTMATIHDWGEAEIDDVAHNVKRDYPEVAKALKAAEAKEMQKHSPYIRECYREYEECRTLEARIVKRADIRQCVQYLETEIQLGNEYMKPLLEESYNYLHGFKLYPNQLEMEFTDGTN